MTAKVERVVLNALASKRGWAASHLNPWRLPGIVFGKAGPPRHTFALALPQTALKSGALFGK
jgi:hypothetical protein